MKVRFAVAPSGDSHSSAGVIAFADATEASGFDGVWLSDIPLGRVLDPLLGLALGLDGSSRGAVLEEALGLVRAWGAAEEVEHHSAVVVHRARSGGPARPEPVGGMARRARAQGARARGQSRRWLARSNAHARRSPRRAPRHPGSGRAGREGDRPRALRLEHPLRQRTTGPHHPRRRARRAEIDPLALVPVGAPALRALILDHVGTGLSKFVVRPVGHIAPWEGEAEWLGEAILDLQT